MTQEQKRFIVEEVLGDIAHIADQEYQERVWIRGEGPECEDFGEAVCSFFDMGDPVLDDYKNFGVTDSQYLLLKNFRDEFRSFCRGHYHPREFINDPEWKRIIDMAKEVVAKF